MEKTYYNELIKNSIYAAGYQKLRHAIYNDNVDEYESLDNRIKIILVDDKDYTNISVMYYTNRSVIYYYDYWKENIHPPILKFIFDALIRGIIKYCYFLKSNLCQYMMFEFKKYLLKDIYESFIDDSRFIHISYIQDPFFDIIKINIFITNSLKLYIPEKYMNKPEKFINRVKKGKIKGVIYMDQLPYEYDQYIKTNI